MAQCGDSLALSQVARESRPDAGRFWFEVYACVSDPF